MIDWKKIKANNNIKPYVNPSERPQKLVGRSTFIQPKIALASNSPITLKKPVVVPAPNKKMPTYVQEFQKGNLGKGFGNLALSTVTSYQDVLRSASSNISSVASGKGFVPYKANVTKKEYENQIAKLTGATPIYKRIAKISPKLSSAYLTIGEIVEDPLSLFDAAAMLTVKGLKIAGSSAYVKELLKIKPIKMVSGKTATKIEDLTQPEIEKIAKTAKDKNASTINNAIQPKGTQTIAQASNIPVQPVKPILGTNIPKEQVFATNANITKPSKGVVLDKPYTDNGEIADVLTSSKQTQSTIKEKVLDFGSDMKRKFIDAGDSVAKIGKISEDKGLYHVYNNARNSRRRAENMIGEAQTNINGKKIGKSIKDIFNPIRKKGDGYYKDFQLYLLHEHNIDRMAQGKPVFGEAVTADMSRQAADDLLKANPEFSNLAQEIYNFNKNNMQYRIDSGLVTPEQAKMWDEMYPHYVPTFRSNPKTKGIIAGKNMAAVEKTVKTAKGGNTDILPLHENMSKQTMQVVEAAHKNIFGNRLIKDATEKTSKYVQDIQSVVDDLDLDKELKDIPDLKNHFRIYKDGEAYEVKVDDSLFEGLQAISGGKDTPNAFIAAATEGNKTFKQLITGWNPMFLVRNGARDIQDVGLYSKNLKKFAQKYPEAVKQMSTNGEMWQQYKALGGAGNSFFDYARGYKNDPTWLRKNTIDRVETLNMSIEQLPRFTEFMATVSKGDGSYDNLMEAMFNSADVTVNFGRSGKWGKTLNSTFVPFFNPAMQGADKMIRRFTETKGVKGWTELVLKAGSLGVAPSLINEMVYKDDPQYQQLYDRDKDINYIIKLGDNEWLKIPKGRVLSLFGATAQRTLRAIGGEENAYAGLLKTMSEQVAPISPISSNILSPSIAISNNKSWFGGKIEPQRLEKFSPGLRYDENTTEIAKWIGGKINYSPKKIDYLLNAYSGVIGDFAMPLTTPKAESNPFAKAFTIDSVTSNKVTQQFYDKKDEIYYAKNDSDGQDANDILYRYMTKQNSMASDLYSEIRIIENSSESDQMKKAKVKTIKSLINGIEQTALDSLSEVEKATEELSVSYKDTDDLYREVNKKVFGSEYALKLYNKDIYAKAQKQISNGISYNQFYDGYFAQKKASSNIGKALALQNKSINNMYSTFEISKTSTDIATALKKSGLGGKYNSTYETLKGFTGSEVKKRMIDKANPGLSYNQLVILYEAFDISQGVGRYGRQFS